MQPFRGGRWDGEERSQTQTLLSHHTLCLLHLKMQGRSSRDPPYTRTKHKLGKAVFRDRLGQGASPLLVQLFCLTHGRQARTFNSQEKHTHPHFFICTKHEHTCPERYASLRLTQETCFSNGSSAAIKVLISVIIVC